jgi:GNAT superfamily N-acetyltransferase
MDIAYVQATPELKRAYQAQSGSNASDFIRFEDGYCSLIAMADDKSVGLIVAKMRPLAEPLQSVQEAFIDIVEVLPVYQRKGIGTALVEQVIAWAGDNQVSQVRAWSEEIRYEALMLWDKLGFAFSQVDFERDGKKRHGFYAAKRVG